MILAILALVLWYLFFLWVSSGLDSGSGVVSQLEEIEDSVTVLVAMRNEEENIEPLLETINETSGLKHPIKVVLVDDSSNDETVALANSAKTELKSIELNILPSQRQGKKPALRQGLDSIETDWIYITDADCTLLPTTIQRMIADCKSQKSRAIFGTVLIQRDGLFSGIQRHEHLNNQIASQSLFNRETPVLVNGANMLFSSSLIDQYRDSLNTDLVSGDDVLFAQSLGPGERSMCLSRQGAVFTQAAETSKSLWNQRIRWLSKQGNQGKVAKAFSATLFSFSLLHLYAVGVMMTSGMWIWLAIYLGLRFIIELSFHSVWFHRLGEKVNYLDAFILTVIYPMYAVVMGLVSLFKPSFEWKGRVQRA